VDDRKQIFFVHFERKAKTIENPLISKQRMNFTYELNIKLTMSKTQIIAI
jgi:hypothetical protein